MSKARREMHEQPPTATRDGSVVRGAGAWTVLSTGAVSDALKAALADPPEHLRLDLGGVDRLDTAGAWTVLCFARTLEDRGIAVELDAGRHGGLVDRLREMQARPAVVKRPFALTELPGRIGAALAGQGTVALRLVAFVGAAVETALRAVADPRRLRMTAVIHHLEQTGVNALPIVGLLCFLIGVVLAYQSADQLARFGAEHITVNVLTISVLREFGVLIAAIIVAGRSGSAFCAQIGTMKVNQEVDAMRTIGLDPMELLVLPRLVALVVAMPLLAVFADAAALLGGLVYVTTALGLTVDQFLHGVGQAAQLNTFAVGIAKAPVFGLLIGLVGCSTGLQVGHSAADVGRRTTEAVVVSIFLVIVCNAAFSIVFSIVGV